MRKRGWGGEDLHSEKKLSRIIFIKVVVAVLGKRGGKRGDVCVNFFGSY